MKAYKNLMFMAVFLSSQAAMPALAQDESDSDELDVTVVEANENAADAVHDIELPEEASDTARMAAEEGGLAVAAAARAGELGDDVEESREEAEEAAMEAELAVIEAVENANEAAAEAVKNALASGASVEDIMESIPQDVIDNLPDGFEDTLNDALDSIPEVETPEVDVPTSG